MDKQEAMSNVQSLQELLDSMASKSKNKKEKPDELHITFQHLTDYPYVMQQSAWELDWDKVKGMYDFHIGIPSFIVDDAVFTQWLPMASPVGTQRWTGLSDPDTLYTQAVLLSLSPLNLLNPAEGREQDSHRGSPKQFVYSAVVVFVHLHQILSTVPEAVSFFQDQHAIIVQGSCSNGWCIPCKLPSFETSRFSLTIPKMLHLVLPVSMSTIDPCIQPLL